MCGARRLLTMTKGRIICRVTEERGIALILSLLVMIVLAVLGLAFLTTARTEDTIAANYRNHTAAFYAAEAGVESGVARLKSLLGGSPVPTDIQLTDLTKDLPALTDPSYTFSTFQVQRVRNVWPYSYQTTLTSGAYAGLAAQTTDYVVTAAVTGPRGSQARLTQKIHNLGIPLFQFMAFYGRGVDFEVAPGPLMTLTGRVHANSNIYMKAEKGLNFDASVTTTGNIYRYVKRDASDRGTNPQIKDSNGVYQTLNFDHEYDYNFANKWPESDWKSAALTTFGGRVQDSTMGVQEILPPIPDVLYDPNKADLSSHLMIEKGSAGDSQALKDAKLYYKADLIIENGAAKKGDMSGCDAKTITTQTFYDARETKDVVVTQVDVGLLKACGKAPANGILYVSKDSGVSTLGGVRLVNGAQLPSQGLTVVSENPVYVQGDYNIKDKKGNLRTVTTPSADLISAAVLGDAITVLSNNWEKKGYDKKGKDVTSKRAADKTTVNAAFATGPNAETVPGSGYQAGKDNGQLNNLIRFLEDWNGVDMNYSGSLVALWHSQQATAWWNCCGDTPGNFFRPPKRNWAYDTLFNTTPPPGTPMGIIITRGQWSEG